MLYAVQSSPILDLEANLDRNSAAGWTLVTILPGQYQPVGGYAVGTSELARVWVVWQRERTPVAFPPLGADGPVFPPAPKAAPPRRPRKVAT